MRAVARFQHAHHLTITGIADAHTRTVLTGLTHSIIRRARPWATHHLPPTPRPPTKPAGARPRRSGRHVGARARATDHTGAARLRGTRHVRGHRQLHPHPNACPQTAQQRRSHGVAPTRRPRDQRRPTRSRATTATPHQTTTHPGQPPKHRLRHFTNPDGAGTHRTARGTDQPRRAMTYERHSEPSPTHPTTPRPAITTDCAC